MLSLLQPVGQMLLGDCLSVETDTEWARNRSPPAQLLRAICLALQGLGMVSTCLTGSSAAAVEMKRSLWTALEEGLGYGTRYLRL